MADAFGLTAFSRLGFASGHSATNHVVDASNEGLGWAFQARAASPISKLFFRYGTRVGTPPTYRISLQSLNASGLPDGTVLGGGSPASATFRPPASAAWDGSGQWITLANTYTPTLNQILCVVIEYDTVAANTIDGLNNGSFCRGIQSLSTLANQLPYGMTNTSGTWSKITGDSNVCFAVEDGIGVYGFPFVSSHTSTLTTSGHRHAAAITLPSGLGQTYTVSSFLVSAARVGSAAGTAIFGIWNSAGTQLASGGTYDADHAGNTTNAGVYRVILTSPVTLNYGTKYYFGIESTGSPINVFGINLVNAADRAAYPLGTNRAWASWDGSVWTETTTRLPYVDLVFDDITVPSGGGETSYISIG